MTEQPERSPLEPEPNVGGEQQHQPTTSPPSETARAASDATPPERPAGWHEPPPPEGSSKPVVVEEWFTPEDAVEPPSEEQAQSPAEKTPKPATPSAEAAPSDAWHTPLDAQLDALFSDMTEDSFVETHRPTTPPPTPSAEETREQPAADTQPEISVTRAEAQTPSAEAAAPVTESAASVPSPEPKRPKEATPPTPKPAPPAEEIAASVAQSVPAEHEAAPQRPSEMRQPVRVTEPLYSASQPIADPARFEEVEAKVKILRERYRKGYLTHDQFQGELRRLMILGENGLWWTMGIDSQKWYYYDGEQWVAATPPGYEARRVRGSAVPTETGVQEVSADVTQPKIEAPQAPEEPRAEEEIPLPRRVPQEDTEATLISPRAAFLEPRRAADAPTLPGTTAVQAGGEGVAAPSPRAAADQPTIPTMAAVGQPTQAHGARVPQAPRKRTARSTTRPPRKSKRQKEFPQPDYSEALVRRSTSTYIIWGVVSAIIVGMVVVVIGLVLLIGVYFSTTSKYRDIVANLRERASKFENTIIYNVRGDVLAEFSNPNTGLREEVPLDQISPWLIHATISTENETFYTDPGFSVEAIVRAVLQNLQAGSTVSGASTITQQLARALVLETELASQRSLTRKVTEAIVATEIKRQYSKNEILEIYLNEIFYGNYAYGVEAAAQTYFNKHASELNPAEAAFLAGLPQSPAQYDPVVNREAAIQRMHTVLRLMSEANGTGCIAIHHDDMTMWGVPNGGQLCIKAEEQADGSVAYYYKTPNTDWIDLFVEIAMVETRSFTAPQMEFRHPHFVNYVWQQLEDKYGSQAIYSAGFRVYTTLDEDIQNAAEQAVVSNLERLRNQGYPANNSSVVVIRPSDGAVLALVGSADYYNEEIKGQVNVAFTAQQPGSTLKPFIYLTSFLPDEQGRYLTPASVLWDVKTNFDGYEPVNYDRRFRGPVAVRQALAQSLNIPAVKALQFVGLLRFTELATRMGIEFPGGNPVETDAGLPTALGAVDVQLFDLTAAYATLANSGRKVEPYSIVFIEDSKGNSIYQAEPNTNPEQIVPPEFAYLVTNILSDREARAAEFGYGWPMELAGGRAAAVKTGTSNDSRDVWTIGYTPQLTVGVWVGTTDNDPMYNPTGYPTYYLTGYYGAAPVWNEVMEAALANVPPEPFAQPPNIIQVAVCEDSGTVPSPACEGRTHVEIFASSAPPPPADQDIFRVLEVDGYTGKLVNDTCRDDVETRVYLVVDDPSAYEWINSTEEGRTWAEQRGIEVPVSPPPTEYCDPNEPRPYVVVSYPTAGMNVQGVLEVRGTVIMPNFHHYEIRYGIGQEPDVFSDPLITETSGKPEANSLLGLFDTQTLQNGPYTLRLVVYDNQGRSVKRDVPIIVNNPQSPTSAPIMTPAFGGMLTPTLAPTLTPIGG